MLTTLEATEAIGQAVPDFGSEPVAVADSVGRVLRQSVFAERDQPPFDRVTMDGIAVRFAALESGQRRFRIAATQYAGDPASLLSSEEDCVEIMTGAVLPQGADCVIPVERIEVGDGGAILESGYQAKQRQFIHPQGSDHAAGTELLGAGNMITPMDVAVVASCGLERIDVGRMPGISIVSTGNELVPAGAPIAPHQIRLSNGPALHAMLAEQGFIRTSHDHLLDEPEALKDSLAQRLAESDVLILSGGVSMGKADFVPQALAEIGVERLFHKISQRPGKPMWFGIGPRQQAVFALPGNPVSALVCCRQYVLPALFQSAGRVLRPPLHAALSEATVFKPNLTCFLPVRVSLDGTGKLLASPVRTNTSGDFAALSGTDGYVELVRESSEFPEGTALPLHLWDRA